jgi:hypothetical protein
MYIRGFFDLMRHSYSSDLPEPFVNSSKANGAAVGPHLSAVGLRGHLLYPADFRLKSLPQFRAGQINQRLRSRQTTNIRRP